MRIAEYKDGEFVYRDMTEEEVVEHEQMMAKSIPEPTLEDRIAQLESQINLLTEEIKQLNNE